MSRDRLVCGVNHAGIQKKLLSEKNLTFTAALDIAQGIEAADKWTKDLIMNTALPHSQGLHYTSQDRSRRPLPTQNYRPCFRCGSNHLPFSCRFKDSDCHKCKQKGHIARMCQLKNKPEATYMYKKTFQHNHFLTNIDDGDVTTESTDE